MTFSNALSNALSGMNAATTAVQVRSNNIANASNPGYARRDVVLSTGVVGGVRVTSIERAGDPILLNDRLSADARSAGLNAQSEAVEQLNQLFGEPGDTQGLFASLTRFETSLDDLAATPESGSYQAATLRAAQDLTNTINRLGDAVTEARTDADREIGATVAAVNRALSALEDLNGISSRGDANGLGDAAEQRQAQIDIIAQALDINVDDAGRGRLRITTAEGVLLLGETARTIEFSSGGIVAPGQTIGSGHLSGLTVDGVDITPKGGAQAIRSGYLAGQFAVRDEIVPEFSDRIDDLSQDIVDRFTGTGVDGTLAPGEEGLFISNGTGDGIAARISVNSAVNPDEGGELWRLRDGINATIAGPSANLGVVGGLLAAIDAPRALSSVTDTPAVLSLSETTAAFASVVGTQRQDAVSAAAAATSTAQSLRDEELAITGVNTDQELQSLLLIEQAYAANARIVQVVSQMMARLLEI